MTFHGIVSSDITTTHCTAPQKDYSNTVSYNLHVEQTSDTPFNMTSFLQQIELRSHADFAESISVELYPVGVIGLLNLNWDGDGKEQSVVYYNTQGKPTTFDTLSYEDTEKRLDVGKAVKILKQDGKEVAHLTSVRADESERQYLEDFPLPQPAFDREQLIVVGETLEEFEANILLISTLLQEYLHYYSSVPKAEFVPREVKSYVNEEPMVADGQSHLLFDTVALPVLQEELAMAAD